ncbi:MULTISPECIES: permease [Arcobacteraceae]|uniref:Permease n=1 Tax=Poseidonibacter parvus TaxID=1850254 RepID=A0A1P8KJ78_9BACT|nr:MULTISPECIES: permease [Arcobacteraceae]APW64556.1 permease [Poseidonibacter parvus]
MIKESFKKAIIGLVSMLPMLFAIILVLGLFDTYITKEMLASMFVSNNFIDSAIGTSMGAVLTGNPMISYILGGELRDSGVSLYAVTAFVLSWVTLGVVQLPAEVEVFGARFTLYRTLLAFITTLTISILTVITVTWIQS